MNKGKTIKSFNLSEQLVESLDYFSRANNLFQSDVIEFVLRDFLQLTTDDCKKVLKNFRQNKNGGILIDSNIKLS